MPASTPPPIHRLRPDTVRVTASTMPMIRPASKTSRKTMTNAASKARGSLLYDQRAARDLFVVLVEEFVAARLLRTDIDGGVGLAGHHLFDVQRLALEFHRLGVEIFQLDDDGRIGGSADFGRIEFLVLVAELNLGRLL